MGVIRTLAKPGLLKVIWHTVMVAARKKFRGETLPTMAGFDITPSCNLRCSHCYIYREEEVKWEFNKLQPTSLEEWEAIIIKLKKENPHICQATWVGGEPLTRPDILRMGTRHFHLNWIITNGTMKFPDDLHNASYFVSLDGSQKYHDEIRGDGVFSRALENVGQTDDYVLAHTVITATNHHSIEEMVEQIQDTNIKGVRFSFYTPSLDVSEAHQQTPVGDSHSPLPILQTNGVDPLYLEPEARDSVVERIHRLRDKYGKFIRMPRYEIDQFLSVNQLKVFGKNCIMPKATRSFDFEGKLKEPCVLGSNADCNRCGCSVPLIADGMYRLKWKSIEIVADT